MAGSVRRGVRNGTETRKRRLAFLVMLIRIDLSRYAVRHIPAIILLATSLSHGAADAGLPASQAAEAQAAHARGICSSLPPGSGLRQGKGWVVSMMPGKHEFRVRGGGDVFLTAARFKGSMDLDSGRLYYIVVEHAPDGSVLEWKFLGSDWTPIPRYFLYPPTN